VTAMQTKEDTRFGLFMVVAVVLAILFMVCVPKADAQGELVGARKARGYGTAQNDTIMISLPANTPANRLPDAYMFFSKQLELFYIQRWFGPTLADQEEIPIPVPAGTSLILPAPPAVVIGGLYHHVFWLNATTVTDSVYVIPMDR